MKSCVTPARLSCEPSSYLQFFKFFPDFDEPYMKFPSEVVGEAAVVVVETEVSGANLTHSQLLLLEAGGRHGVTVDVLNTTT